MNREAERRKYIKDKKSSNENVQEEKKKNYLSHVNLCCGQLFRPDENFEKDDWYFFDRK